MVFEDGHAHCNRCGYHVKADGHVSLHESEDINTMNIADANFLAGLPYGSCRGVTKETAEHFGVLQEYNTKTREPVSEYYPVTKNKKVTGYKVRKYPKDSRRWVTPRAVSCLDRLPSIGRVEDHNHRRGAGCHERIPDAQAGLPYG
jgi:hypothetical protein